VLLVVVPAKAASRVAVVGAAASTREDIELVTRVRAELQLAGFEAVPARFASDTSDAASELQRLAESTGSIAAIAVVRPPGAIDAQVWVTDRVTGKTLLRRVHFAGDAPDAPAIFALRAVELLRASLLELAEEHPQRGQVAPTRAVREWVARPLEPEPERRYALRAGAGVMAGPGGLGATLAPMFAATWRPLASWSLELFASGPALGSIEGAEGEASFDREVVAARARFEPNLGTRSAGLWLALGPGVHHFGVRGSAAQPFRARSDDVWSAALLAGIGAKLRVVTALSLGVELDALLLTPRPVVRFAEREVAAAGSPTAGGFVTCEVSW
jgi:hypothetical protein